MAVTVASIWLLTVVTVAGASTPLGEEARPTIRQPAPVLLEAAKCPPNAQGHIRAWLKFHQQQPAANLQEFVTNHDLSILTLGWEWGDHQTHFPIKTGQPLDAALRDLQEYQKAHLTSLIHSTTMVLDTNQADTAVAEDLRSQLADYRRQLTYVSNNPIQVAAIEIGMPASRTLAVDNLPDVRVTDCRGDVPTPKLEKPPVKETPIKAMYGSYKPTSGEILLTDLELDPSAPYMINYFRFSDLSEFTGDHKSYEHDVKIEPWDFTECLRTRTWDVPGDGVGPTTDCSGIVSTNLPSTAAWYYDTRFMDEGQKDFTMGIRWTNTLTVNTSYWFKVSLTDTTESEATLYLDRQLQGAPTNAIEQTFCIAYTPVIGVGAACAFPYANEDAKTFTILSNEVNYYKWSD